MRLDEANALAWNHMRKWGLVEKGWSFRFDRAKRRIGCCKYREKEITLSEHLTRLNEQHEIEDTILHEIAHALVGKEAGHGPKWKAMAIKVGATPERCGKNLKTPDYNYIIYCEKCGAKTGRHRLYKKTVRRIRCKICGPGTMKVIDQKNGKAVTL